MKSQKNLFDVSEEARESVSENDEMTADKTTLSGPAIISVSAYLDRLNATLKTEKAKIVGEVTGVQMYEERSYMYFSIKDSADHSTLKCFMWKRDFKLSGVALRDGLEVVVTAYPSMYKPNGTISLQVEHIELVGEGALQLAYEELKKKLDLEGLFAESAKRSLPEYPHKIGVITSKSGAVIHDFLSNIGKFGFEILFVDSKVEGVDATKDLLAAIQTLRSQKVDVLVMMRGGGSLESFLAFNNEVLVRAVRDFPAPVLTGIGHDKDISLVALASDKNVSTPTAVANMLNASWSGALSAVTLSEHKIIAGFESAVRDRQYEIENAQVIMEKRFARLFETFRRAEEALLQAMVRIESGLARAGDLIVRRSRDVVRGFEILESRVSERLAQSEKILSVSDPVRQLARGYSIVKIGGKVVRKTEDAVTGEQLDIMVSDGMIHTKVV